MHRAAAVDHGDVVLAPVRGGGLGNAPALARVTSVTMTAPPEAMLVAVQIEPARG